ncbi:MAG: TIGR02757 family protein [Candidatus Auribacterota bacterium]
MKINTAVLDNLYTELNRREYVHPDPLEVLYEYPDVRDMEIAGLIASCLAYGRVTQILISVRKVLGMLGSSPYSFLLETDTRTIAHMARGFKHRFTTDGELFSFLSGIKNILHQYGSLEHCFLSYYTESDDTILPALTGFVRSIRGDGGRYNSLLPDPSLNSACKRLMLYLRWMARHDAVDPGGWHIPTGKLIIPLDVHMHRISTLLGLTARKQADMRTALEITGAFKSVNTNDPVKYDFALTRLGIRQDTDLKSFIEKYGKAA